MERQTFSLHMAFQERMGQNKQTNRTCFRHFRTWRTSFDIQESEQIQCVLSVPKKISVFVIRRTRKCDNNPCETNNQKAGG